MRIFLPTLGCHFKLIDNVKVKLLTNKNNVKILHKLNLLPGCLPLSAWLKGREIFNIEITLPKDTVLTIDRITDNRLDSEIHFSIYEKNVKKDSFALLLKDISGKFEIEYA